MGQKIIGLGAQQGLNLFNHVHRYLLKGSFRFSVFSFFDFCGGTGKMPQ